MRAAANDFVPETVTGGALKYPPTVQCLKGPWTAPTTCNPITTSTFAGLQNPVAIAASRSNSQLVIAENGPNQYLISCNTSGATPTCSSIGATNGVFNSTGAKGLIATGATQIRLFSPFGVGFSGSGSSESLWVADQAPGFAIHKLDQSGIQAVPPSFAAPYGIGDEAGTFDPLSPGDYYTATRHLTFDTTKTAAGSEWALKAVTWNPFDPRIAEMTARCPEDGVPQHEWCLSDTNPNAPDTYWDTLKTNRHNDVRIDRRNIGKEPPIIRHLQAADPVIPAHVPASTDPVFMYVPYSIGYVRHLAIFRFEGEIAVPVASFEFQPPSANDPPNAPAALRLWLDTPTNPDGLRPLWPDTTETKTSTNLGFAPPANASSVEVDANGNVWFVLGQYVWKFKMLGVVTTTVNGVNRYVPRYALDQRVEYQIPSSLYSQMVFRVDSTPNGATDTMYLAGYQTAPTEPVCGLAYKIVLGAYDVSAAVPNHATAPKKYERDISFGVGTPDDYEFEVINPGCACTQNPDWVYNSLSLAGNYLFLGERPGMVNVRRKSDGGAVAHLFAGPEESGMVNYSTDAPETVKAAVVTSTGEYLVTRTDVSDLGRTSVFRWTPPTAYTPASLNPTAWYVASALDVDQSSGHVSSWLDRSGNQHDATQTNFYGQPTFNVGWSGNPTLTFSGNQVLLANWTASPGGTDQPVTILAVARSAASQDATLIGWANPNNISGVRAALVPSGTATLATLGRDGDLAQQLLSNATDVTTVGHVFAWRFANNNSLTVTVDGNVYTPVATYPEPGPLALTNIVIGARNLNPNGTFRGDISEIVVVPAAISDADVQAFRTYAKTKWAGLP